MSATDRFERIEELFRAAIEMPRDRWQQFLASRCGTDAVLMQQVLAMLSKVGAEDRDSFLLRAREAARRDDDRSDLPDRIGPYHPLEILGEGGMGTVYLCEQRQPVRRRVALKVIKLGMDSKAVLARFDAERQALSMMEHGCVARIFDAGITDEGRPYFAMEYVKGVPLTDYCDQNRLSLDARIKLFRQVCSGVQHAHLKGVMHRDLKPSNVLVTVQDGKPVPKIIDFGLAKAMDHRLVEATLFTGHGQIIGTPEYMSPEQAGLGGLDVDTRTDVYSLGVLLYELLTGELPFSRRELVGQGYSEMQRILRETDPPKPSTRLTTLGDAASETARRRNTELIELRRHLRGDLDWIVMKALEKDRTRRYETAMELAADLERHLNHLPVMASPPSVAYRVRKYVRRHRPTVIASVVAVIALVGGTVAMFVGWREAEAQTVQANTQRARADEQAGKLQRLWDKFNLLHDSEAVGQLLAREPELEPALPAIAGELRGWLAEADQVLAREAVVKQAIAELGTVRDDDAAFLARTLTPLVERMQSLAARRADVQERLEWANAIENLTKNLGHRTWSNAREDIARSDVYRAVPIADLQPQLGLVPIGPNPKTGLWEFYDLRSAWDPRAGRRPQDITVPDFDADGRIAMTAEMGVVFVLVPGGTLRMGADDDDEMADPQSERPQQEVALDPFLLSQFELTQAQWLRLEHQNPSTFHPGFKRVPTTLCHPVEGVAWLDCDRYCHRLGWALPTEAQWEWACRAGGHTPWSTGSTVASLEGAANLFDASAPGRWEGVPVSWRDHYPLHAPVGTFRPNAFGLHDMHGNLWEWCQDFFHSYGEPGFRPRAGDGLRVPIAGITEPPAGRVVRGGCYTDGARKARSAYRFESAPTSRNQITGARPARLLTR